MKTFRISPRVRAKLAEKHQVTAQEVMECFANRIGPAFRDTRAKHETDPATQWFIAETDTRRWLKIIYIEYPDFFAIKSAYAPNRAWIDKYRQLCAAHARQ